LHELAWPDAEDNAAERRLDRVVAPEERRRKIRHLCGRLVDRPVDRTYLGEAPEGLDELVAVEALARGRDQLHEDLAGVAPLADNEMAQVTALVGLAVGLEAL